MDGEINLGERLLLLDGADGIIDLLRAGVVIRRRSAREAFASVHSRYFAPEVFLDSGEAKELKRGTLKSRCAVGLRMRSGQTVRKKQAMRGRAKTTIGDTDLLAQKLRAIKINNAGNP